MSEKKTFQIQIATEIIRNNQLLHESFYVYCKLIQHYYIRKEKSIKLSIDHKKFMYFSNIKSNQTFKKCMNQLHEQGLVVTKINTLPRSGMIEIELNSKYVGIGKDFKFAQLPYYLLDQCILNQIGYEGFRLLFYLKSYVNNGMEYCFCSREVISEEIGSNPKTVDKYALILKKSKLIKIVKHELKSTGEYELDEFGTDKEKFTKYNNHYFLRFDQFETVHKKLKMEVG